MSTDSTRAHLLGLIRHEQAAWDQLLAEVGEAHMLEPGVIGAWTFKDLIGHLSAWRQEDLGKLEAAQRDEPPRAPWAADLPADADTDAINDWIYASNRDRPLSELVAESRQQFEQLEQAVNGLSEHDLSDPKRFPWMQGHAVAKLVRDSFVHYPDDHQDDIKRWLAGHTHTSH